MCEFFEGDSWHGAQASARAGRPSRERFEMGSRAHARTNDVDLRRLRTTIVISIYRFGGKSVEIDVLSVYI